MTKTLQYLPVTATTNAQRRAASNWALNLDALSQFQPHLAEQMRMMPGALEWLFARDGYLTAIDRGQWWSACSIPLRAAQHMMRTLDVSSTTACMLNPAHAAQLRAVLDLLQRQQGVIVLQPSIAALRVMLCCDDFSLEIARHRLSFACGQGWEDELRRAFEETPGLPTPSQFLRPVAAEYSEADSLVAPAQKIFAQVNAERTKRIARILQAPKNAESSTVCVIAPSCFRLWDNAGSVLADVLNDEQDLSIQRFDPDDPACASPLALAEIARGCGAIVAANTARADLPEVVHRQTPWLTWMTTPRIPNAVGRAPHDAILVADERWLKMAVDAGWPPEKAAVAAWPVAQMDDHGPAGLSVQARETASAHVAILGDLLSLEPPRQIAEYSSHALLWDAIAEELLNNPFALRDLDEFLDDRMSRLQITVDRFDRALFIGRLIVPAYQQGLAQLLVGHQVPLRCYGRGWDKAHAVGGAAGAIESREEFAAAISASRAVVHCWPVDHSHPSDAHRRPIIRAFGRTREQFLRDVMLAMTGRLPPPSRPLEPLTAAVIMRLIRSTQLGGSAQS